MMTDHVRPLVRKPRSREYLGSTAAANAKRAAAAKPGVTATGSAFCDQCGRDRKLAIDMPGTT